MLKKTDMNLIFKLFSAPFLIEILHKKLKGIQGLR